MPQACHAAKASGVVVQYSKYIWGVHNDHHRHHHHHLPFLQIRREGFCCSGPAEVFHCFRRGILSGMRCHCRLGPRVRLSETVLPYCFARAQVVLFDRGTSILSQFIGKPVMPPIDHRRQFGFSAALPFSFKYRPHLRESATVSIRSQGCAEW